MIIQFKKPDEAPYRDDLRAAMVHEPKPVNRWPEWLPEPRVMAQAIAYGICAAVFIWGLLFIMMLGGGK